MTAKEYSLINKIVQNDIYVDIRFSRKNTEEKVLERACQLELVVN